MPADLRKATWLDEPLKPVIVVIDGMETQAQWRYPRKSEDGCHDVARRAGLYI
jgi:hypothetical protein